MSDPVVCCILGVCCPPGSEKQREALASALQLSESASVVAEARTYADYILDNFDLAPKGSLVELIAAIAKHSPERK